VSIVAELREQATSTTANEHPFNVRIAAKRDVGIRWCDDVGICVRKMSAKIAVIASRTFI